MAFLGSRWFFGLTKWKNGSIIVYCVFDRCKYLKNFISIERKESAKMEKTPRKLELTRSAVPDEIADHPAVDLIMDLAIHENLESGRIIINYPGCMGDIDGYNNKYLTLANFVQEKVGAVIRTGNEFYNGFDYSKSVQDDLRTIIEYAIENSEEICGAKVPAIYLMGFSAGASAIAAVAHEYPQVQKILLMAPSGDAGEEAVSKGLGEFTGEVYVLGGANDDVVGPEAAPHIYSLIKKASKHQLVIIPKCDHQFKGTENGLIVSKAPLWAFLGEADFPSTDGGVELY
jgi:dienelactone hydrolase